MIDNNIKIIFEYQDLLNREVAHLNYSFKRNSLIHFPATSSAKQLEWIKYFNNESREINKTKVKFKYIDGDYEALGEEATKHITVISLMKVPSNLYKTETANVIHWLKDIYKNNEANNILGEMGLEKHCKTFWEDLDPNLKLVITIASLVRNDRLICLMMGDKAYKNQASVSFIESHLNQIASKIHMPVLIFTNKIKISTPIPSFKFNGF